SELSSLVEYLTDVAEVDVPEDINQSELTHDGQKILDCPHAAKGPCGYADYPGSLMDVFLETTVQNMLQQSREAMIVFRRDNHQRVSPGHLVRERRILHRFACIVGRQWHFRDVDELREDLFTLRNLLHHKSRCVVTHASFACCAENHGDAE